MSVTLEKFGKFASFAGVTTGGLVCAALACSGHGSAAGPASNLDAALAPDALVEDAFAGPSYDGLPTLPAPPRTPVKSEFLSLEVDTMSLMFAAGEMQTSGEPFASNFAGRNLADYDRFLLPPNLYLVHAYGGSQGFAQSYVDLFGFSTAVESYEYSKYHMNMVANQTGAGVSLANGPLILARPGSTPFDKLRARIGELIQAAGTDVGGYAKIPDGGATNPQNDFGFGGLWPNLMPYRHFDPAMAPDTTIAHSCATVTGYGGIAVFGNNPVPYYECRYNSLHLLDRTAQTEPIIGPGILGYTTWKEALWAIDFTGRLHNSQANFVSTIAPNDIASVGRPGNLVQPVLPTGAAPGVFIGSTPLEGMWGLTMVDEMDNAGAWLLSSLATSDGATLAGFASISAALSYDYGSPLMWFPTAIAVTEAPAAPSDAHGDYPAVASLRIEDATSRSVDLAALAQGYSLFFGMTDARNVAVGQQVGSIIAFGGYPFAADDGQPDGEDTPHDRALAIMRAAFVDLDRIHADPGTGVLLDEATVQGGAITRGPAVTTPALGHVVVGLRHLLMACNSAVSQYGAPDGDASKDGLGILNSIPLRPNPSDPSATALFSPRVRQVLSTQADFVLSTLTQADGSVRNGASWTAGSFAPTTEPATIESQSAALRVLVEQWFLSRDPKYQTRAQAVARRLLSAFWSDSARMFRATDGGADDIVMTPERFGWLQQALREIYEALWVAGDSLLDRDVLEDRIARINKLYLNGWDDLNGDQTVQKGTECLAGRLQLGEQALTGELGMSSNAYQGSSGPDRDDDCVPNIAYANVKGDAGVGSVLAGQVHFHAP
jgi:hypothetical protein